MTRPHELSDHNPPPANAYPPDQAPDAVEVVARALCEHRQRVSAEYKAFHFDGQAHDLAQAAIAALRAYDEGRGYVTVPREPTQAMLDACAVTQKGMTFSAYPRQTDAALYRAMIAAETGE